MPKRLRVASCALLALSALSGIAAASESRRDLPAACPTGEVRVEEGCLRKPEAVEKSPPVYPKEAHKQGVEASVVVSARVGLDGSVEEAKAVDSGATDESFVPEFEEAAVRAVRKWRYRPGLLNGRPAPVYFSVTINFRLK